MMDVKSMTRPIKIVSLAHQATGTSDADASKSILTVLLMSQINASNAKMHFFLKITVKIREIYYFCATSYLKIY